MRKEKFSLGIVGCGAFGEFCANAYSKLANVKISCVCDIRPKYADTLGRIIGAKPYYDYSQMIKDGDIDIVHIATPPAGHHNQVMQAAEAGKHILCEKPLAMDLDQADDMLAEAAVNGTILPVNFVLRYNKISRAIETIIKSGILGKPLSARLTNCAQDSGLGVDHWFWNKDISGGIFIEHGVHFFDLYKSWFGPGEVVSALTLKREKTSQEDRVMCRILHDNNCVCEHYHGFDQLSILDRTDHRIVFELGDIHIDGWIPLSMRLNAASNAEKTEFLEENCPGCKINITKPPADDKPLTSRGKKRDITQLIELNWVPDPDKTAVYTKSIQDLLADQLAYLNDNSHHRTVTESNGRNALELACHASHLAHSFLASYH